MVNDLLKQIQQIAEKIQPQLKALPTHPQRNAYAHIHGVIKTLCKASYKEADPLKVEAILEVLELDPNYSLEQVLTQAKIRFKQKKLNQSKT